jgi:hypothetical protein
MACSWANEPKYEVLPNNPTESYRGDRHRMTEPNKPRQKRGGRPVMHASCPSAAAGVSGRSLRRRHRSVWRWRRRRVVLHDGYGRCRTAWCEVPGGGGGGFRLACSRGPRLIGIGFGGGQGQALYCGGLRCFNSSRASPRPDLDSGRGRLCCARASKNAR